MIETDTAKVATDYKCNVCDGKIGVAIIAYADGDRDAFVNPCQSCASKAQEAKLKLIKNKNKTIEKLKTIISVLMISRAGKRMLDLICYVCGDGLSFKCDGFKSSHVVYPCNTCKIKRIQERLKSTNDAIKRLQEIKNRTDEIAG